MRWLLALRGARAERASTVARTYGELVDALARDEVAGKITVRVDQIDAVLEDSGRTADDLARHVALAIERNRLRTEGAAAPGLRERRERAEATLRDTRAALADAKEKAEAQWRKRFGDQHDAALDALADADEKSLRRAEDAERKAKAADTELARMLAEKRTGPRVIDRDEMAQAAASRAADTDAQVSRRQLERDIAHREARLEGDAVERAKRQVEALQVALAEVDLRTADGQRRAADLRREIGTAEHNHGVTIRNRAADERALEEARARLNALRAVEVPCA